MMQDIQQALASAKRVLFVTGAGLSADSGLPTYRGVGGLYDVKDTDDGVPIERALSGSMFAANPMLVWKYIRQIEEACRGAQPNLGHLAIAQLQERTDVTVLTQNVDGLHTAAGSENIIEMHGCLHRLFCTSCSWQDQVVDYQGLSLDCPDCGQLIRPDVVLFEEALPSTELAKLQQGLEQGFDMVFSVGTSAMFPYIAQPVRMAPRWGAVTVEINPSRTPLSRLCDYQVAMGAAQALAALVGS